MALSINHVQSVWGEFKPVLNESAGGSGFSVNHVQSVWGEFVAVLDEAAHAAVGVHAGGLLDMSPLKSKLRALVS
jgi:hypothetical protein